MTWQETIASALRTDDGSLTVAIIVWAIYLGIMFGALFGYYHKKIIGGFIRALCENGAYSPAEAKTAEELGQERNCYALRALKRRGGTLRKLVACEEGRYYIDGEKNQMRARSQYKPDRSNLLFALLIALAMIGVAMAIFLVLPQVIDNLRAL
ncbi:MAG: hypothetical protein J5940_06195 [Clostridia bacterium]|nr:hypothetical protein [Clostridia bacterium]